MKVFSVVLLALSLLSTSVMADEYVIDKKGMHASIQFRKDNLNASKINVTINTSSIDSNHAERDKHLRGEEFLDVEQFPQASFVSTSFTMKENGSSELKGDFTLRGITKSITIYMSYLGEGNDPWGGYRAGFEGTTELILADYGILKELGPASKKLDLFLSIEGIKK